MTFALEGEFGDAVKYMGARYNSAREEGMSRMEIVGTSRTSDAILGLRKPFLERGVLGWDIANEVVDCSLGQA
jgi:hypothetical protein